MAWHQSPSLWIQQFADGLAVLQFDPPGKATRLTLDVLNELDAALTAVEGEPRFRALMIRSLKPGRFVQGLDVAGWKALHAAGDVDQWAERGQAIWNRLHHFKIPSIAWIQGTCLGAGLELALACDQIVLVDQPEASLGFSELDLGAIPSWGGYGPLVRRIGIANAFPLALAGRRLTPREAFSLGLVDRLAPKDEPDFKQILALAQKRDPNLWTRRTWRQQLFERFARGRAYLYRGVERLHQRRLPEGLPAAGVALAVLKEFIERDDAAGQAAARLGLTNLTQTPAFANLVRLHELRDRAQIPPGKLGASIHKKTIAILGTTPLGIHLLMEIVRRDGTVVLRETDETALGVAILKLVQLLGHEIQSGTMTPQESQKFLSRIKSTVTWKNFGDVDFVVDARDRSEISVSDVVEIEANVDAKSAIVIASAGGRLETAAAAMSHPQRLAGIAVPSPIGTFPVVEWRRVAATDAGVAKNVKHWLGGLNWVPIETRDSPGLLLARLWVPAWNEMVTLLREGASLKFIDEAMIRFGMARGPLEYLDSLGLDRAQKLIEAVREEVEPRIPLDPFWTEVLDRGWKGKSSRKGFYRYGRGKPEANHLLVNWLRQEGPRHGSPLPVMSNNVQRHFIQERVILLMVNEAYRCLESRLVETGDILDLAMMLTDWAPHRGGPIQYARDVGISVIAGRLRELAVHGMRYEPCGVLLE